MDGKRDLMAAWIAKEILPHENTVRVWIRRRWFGVVDPDDVLQEAYCRLSGLSSFSHIENPVGYFRRTVYSAAMDLLRSGGTINFISMTENDWLNVIDDEPLADRAVAAEQELRRVNGLLGRLSETCRRAIELRRVEGVSQREAADQLGVSEDVIRNHLVRGVKAILKDMSEQDGDLDGHERPSKKERVKG